MFAKNEEVIKEAIRQADLNKEINLDTLLAERLRKIDELG
jgi:hypothetical protein